MFERQEQSELNKRFELMRFKVVSLKSQINVKKAACGHLKKELPYDPRIQQASET